MVQCPGEEIAADFMHSGCFAGIHSRIYVQVATEPKSGLFLKYLFLIMRLGLLILQRVFYVLTAGEWPPFASVAVVVEREGRFLMINRRDGRGYGLPGGYIKLHETAEDAAIREVKEETGYDVQLKGVRDILSGKRKSTRVRAVDVVFNGEVVGGEMQDSLEGKCYWVQLDEVRDQIAFDYLKAIEAKSSVGAHS